MPINPLNHHYAMENPASVYDEEAMTALELAGRTTAKVNEVVKATNEAIANIPGVVAKDVQTHIKKGAFDQQIDEHTKTMVSALSDYQHETNTKVGNLDNRLDNLILNSGDSTAEVADMRTGADGDIYTTAGVAMRKQIKSLFNAVDGARMYGLLDSLEVGFTISEDGVRYPDASNTRASSAEFVNIPEPFYVHVRYGYLFAYNTYDAKDGHLENSGWLRGLVKVPAGRLRFIMCKANNTLITLSEAKCAVIRMGEDIDRLNRRCNAMDYPLMNLILGWGGYVQFDTVNRVITIPQDTLYVTGYDAPGSARTLNTAATINIDYSAMVSSAVKVLYNLDTSEFEVYSWSTPVEGNYAMLCCFRGNYPADYPMAVNIACPYMVDGKPFNLDISMDNKPKNNLVKSICHRGYNTVAPENTLPAFSMAKAQGFEYVECDIHFTSDGVPVLIHDDTVDRTSNGSGSVSALTFASIRNLDFGSWKSATYAGVTIPSFEEFLALCKGLGVHPYIEIKTELTDDQAKSLIGLVKRYGMCGNVSWITTSPTNLTKIVGYDNKARVGLVVNEINSATITAMQNLQTGNNDVFVDMNYTTLTTNMVEMCYNADIPLEVWTVNTSATIANLDHYITGYTSDSLNAGGELVNINGGN